MPEQVETQTTAPAWTPREQNGVKEYRPGSIGARVWALADAITQRKGEWCSAAEIVEEGTAAGIVKGSCTAGYATWRKFNGLAGHRIDDPAKAAKKAEAEAAKAAKAAEREAAKVAKAEAAAAKAAEREAEKQRKADEKAAKAAEKAAKREADAAAKAEAAAAAAEQAPPPPAE